MRDELLRPEPWERRYSELASLDRGSEAARRTNGSACAGKTTPGNAQKSRKHRLRCGVSRPVLQQRLHPHRNIGRTAIPARVDPDVPGNGATLRKRQNEPTRRQHLTCSAALRSNLQHSPGTPPQSRLRPRGQISPVRRGQPDWQGGNCHPSIPRCQHRRAQGARHARPAARQIIRHSPDSGNNGSCPANAPASRDDRTEPRKDRCHPSIPRCQHRRAQGARHARPAARQIIRHSPDSGNNGSCPANAPASRDDRTEPRKDRLPRSTTTPLYEQHRNFELTCTKISSKIDFVQSISMPVSGPCRGD